MKLETLLGGIKPLKATTTAVEIKIFVSIPVWWNKAICL